VVQPPCMIPETVQFQGVTIPAGCFLHAVSGGRGGEGGRGGHGGAGVGGGLCQCVGVAWFALVCLAAGPPDFVPPNADAHICLPLFRSRSCGLEAPTRNPCGRHRRSDTLPPCGRPRCGGPLPVWSCGGPLALIRFLACLENWWLRLVAPI
jgi:hypothetical protein